MKARYVTIDLTMLRLAFTDGIGHTDREWRMFWKVLVSAGAVK